MLLRRNILLFHLGALGDFVLTWPLALALARLHPQSRIIYVTHGQKGTLAEKALNLESADIEAGWHHLYGDPAALPAPAAKLLQGAHSIYSFIATDAWAANVLKLSPQTRLSRLNARPPADCSGHATEYLLSQLAGDPAAQEATRQILHSLNANGLKRLPSTMGQKHRIAIHPGSGSSEKCWPAERFVELAARLGKGGHLVKVLLGEAELERWPAECLHAFRQAAEVRLPRTYVDLLGELLASTLFLGNDSGPGHLAGILGLSTYCLFGPTSPEVWHPIGPHVHTLRHPLLQLDVDRVNGWLGTAMT